MAFESVPWMIGGGALHSAEVGRLLGYVAFNGNEGVIGVNDLRVFDLDVPGASVKVRPGACSILCRAPGQTYQAYAGRMTTQEVVPIGATGGTARSDMIVARIEDPYLSGEPWDDPADPTVGPYIFTRVISDVPSTATTVTELGLGYSAIPLARIDIPASTGTITQEMITDLRWLANPRQETVIFHKNSTSNDLLEYTTGEYERFPNGVYEFVKVPDWATTAVLNGWVEGIRQTKIGTGNLRIAFAGTGVASQATQVNEDKWVSGTYDRRTYNVGGEVVIPESLRGTTVVAEMQGRATTSGSNQFLSTDDYSSGLISITWQGKAINA